MKKPLKRPRDINQNAHLAIGVLTGQIPNPDTQAPPDDPRKNKAAVELGRLGGAKGGPARAKALSPEERSQIARRAALKRWGKA